MNNPNAVLPKPPASIRRELAGDIIASAAVLGVLYFGREVLVPITLAAILSLVLLPLVRRLKRFGLGQTSAVLASVSMFAIFVATLATVIGVQVVHVAASLPQYEETIQTKVKALRELSVDRMAAVQNEAGRMFDGLDGQSRDVRAAGGTAARGSGASAHPLRVEIQEPRESPQRVIGGFLSSVWGPLETTGIVLVVLVFVLLEHEPLRDRVIRLAGSADLRVTTTAINDAGERLSRYFAAQFAVNFAVGVAIWIGLIAFGFPQATLWATLTAVLRFVPYVGTVMAAASAAVFAAAVVPGWDLLIMTVVLYLIVETIAGQVVEPMFFGHTTGLSPLSVVIGAIFWTWMWGPVGLIVSTPLTVCLLVVGRHVKAFAFLDILLGDAPALTMSERFYQRALSGDVEEIMTMARSFVKRKTFAAYGDTVLMRAMQLAQHDVEAGRLAHEEQVKVRDAILAVTERLTCETRLQSRKPRLDSLLKDPNGSRHQRHRREPVSAAPQGQDSAPLGSMVLALGLGSPGDDLAAEVLVRSFRHLKIDARHLPREEVGMTALPDSKPPSVAIVCVVSTASERQAETYTQMAEKVRRWLPDTFLVALLLPGLLPRNEWEPTASGDVDVVVKSFEEAAQCAIARIPHDFRGLAQW
jgi:predicted PurR-regulated permease PerM